MLSHFIINQWIKAHAMPPRFLMNAGYPAFNLCKMHFFKGGLCKLQNAEG